MIQVHIRSKGTERFYATRLSVLDVLANLAVALRAEESYIRLRSYLDAYDIDQGQTYPVIRITAHESRLSDQDSVEVWSEHFTLGELSYRFPCLI